MTKQIAAFAAACMAAFMSHQALSQASGDGRVGPHDFGDAALDAAMAALNDHLQAKYAQDDMLAALAADRSRGFVEVARTHAPDDTSFGDPIAGDASLDAHLAALGERLRGAEGITLTAALPPSSDDGSFDAYVLALASLN